MSYVSRTNGLCFNNNHVSIEIAQKSNADRVSVIRMTLPFNEAPPLHVHHEEDELFHILSGEIRYRIGDLITVKRAGDSALAPRGIPHGFRVISKGGATVLIITRGGFEEMVRSVSRPAAIAGLPDQVEPSPEMQAMLTDQCALRNIEILGAPIA